MSDREALRQRLQRLFLEELDEHVARLEHGLEQAAESLPHLEASTVEELFRSAHSLKGAAQAIGMTTVGTLCHHLEDALARVREGSLTPDEQLLERMAAVTQAVAEAGRRFREGEEQPSQDITPVIAALTAYESTDEQAGGEPRHAPPQTAPDPPDPSTHQQPPPSQPPGAGTQEGGTIRVAAETFDALLAHAGDLVTMGYRSQNVMTELSTASVRLVESEDALREDLRLLRRALGDTGNNERVSNVLGRIDTRFRQASSEVGRLAHAAARHQRELAGLTRQFAGAARTARMVPFTDATAGLSRVVRSVATAAGKRARLEVEAADVRIDRRLVATLHDILGHLVRNAVDHGLEPPSERVRAGKHPVGLVRVAATLRSDGIEIVVVDDGRGVQVREVQAAARHLGVDRETGEEPNLTATLFRPGLTTAERVTSASGRGVGLDVVRSAVEAAGGTVTLETEQGVGVSVEMILPLTLSTVRAVLVRVADEVVALPSSVVQKFTRLPLERARTDGHDVVSVDGEMLPVVRLAGVLGWTDRLPAGDGGPALVLSGPEGRVAVIVDSLLHEREVVLQAMPPRLAGAALVLGTAQLEDGSIVLVLNASSCVRIGMTEAVRHSTDVAETPSQPHVLLVEDTLTTRELERSILEAAGYSVIVTSNGSEAWRVLQSQPVDAVVSDVNMPTMDGIALCRAIRGSAYLAALPVVLVTSLHSDEDRRAGLEAGADAYLTKAGFDREDLLRTLDRLL